MNRLLILLIVLSSCSSRNKVKTLERDHMASLIGKKITVTGEAADSKLGAMIIVHDSLHLWIDEKYSWPSGYYYGHDSAKTLKVTGTLIERYDLPVFVLNKNDSNIRQGIPVPPGTDLKKASHRYLLKNVDWEVLSK